LFGLLQRDVYDSIKKKEIILPEEHTGQLGFDYAWKELLARAPKAGSSSSCYLHLQFSID
jgi:brefeldin A-resistance guanine nucleotide exchange factor 1